MDPLSLTVSVVAILQLTTEVIKYLNDVKDAPKDRASFAIEASNLSNLLVSLRYRWEEARSNEAWYREVEWLAVQDGPLDQYKHALERLQLKILGGKGLAKIGNALAWKFSKEEVASILSRIERLKSLVQIALQMDHFKLSQEIKRCMDEINSDNQAMRNDVSFVRDQMPVLQDGVYGLQVDVEKLQLGVEGFQQDADRQKHDMLMEWISSTNFPAQQSDLISRRQAGTGQWFLNSPEFGRWLYGQNETLFCRGIPGAGKTMMAAITIDQLSTMTESDAIGVAYIFCNYKTQADQTATNLLATILKQLVHSRPSIAEPVSRLYENHRGRMSKLSVEEIFAALQNVIRNLARVYVVVDGLDECSDQQGNRSQLLGKLRDLQVEADVHLLVTSRYNPDIENKFKLVPKLEVRASDMDVKEFVQGQIYRLPRCIQRDEELQGIVGDKIVGAVDGMFLLAHLHVDSLQDKRTKAQVLSTLEKLSKGSKSFAEGYDLKSLNKAYDEAIKRVEAQLPEDSRLAKKVLSWITYAHRPLTIGELCHALAVVPGEEDLDEDNVLDVEDILSVCAGLVILDEESTIIRLVHYTTQEYFERIRENWNPSAQLEITSACLTYLSLRPFRSGSCRNNKEFESRLEKWVFLNYASCFWGLHAQTVQEQVYDLASVFLHNVTLISCAVRAMSIPGHKWGNFGQFFIRKITGLHLAAGFGLEYFSEILLSETGRDVSVLADSKDEFGQTPLSWAAENGHEALTKLLVERDDVEADSKDESGQTPLAWAAENGHESVVTLLVERDDVEADLKEVDGRTPLSRAASNGHWAIVKLLVERDDVEADSKDYYNWTPLLYAAIGGHEAIVKLLLERDDVEADSKDDEGRTPLSWAAENGHEAVVKLLVENKNCEANSKDNHGWAPLSCAAMRGHGAIVKLLIGRDDVEADSKDHEGRTPLSWAAENGHEGIVKLLVGRDDVEANSKDKEGRTPLLWAARAGQEAIVKLLVDRNDVEADSEDKYGRTPLSWAAQKGHEMIVKLLVQRSDIDADSKDVDDWTPLSSAARRGYESIVRLLLERDDVDADSKDKYGRTPLSWAAYKGQEAIVKLLLERSDVEATLTDDLGRTPLKWAVEEGHGAVAKLLQSKLS